MIKSRRVDLERGENFGFLGFDFRYLRSLRGVMRPHYTPKLKKRTALLRELKEVFRRHRSQPIERVISLVNPMLRGWVNYFAVGNSSECFTYIRDWVEKKVRRHLAHARKRKGFGWERWSRPWLYDTLGLFNSYRVRHNEVDKMLERAREVTRNGKYTNVEYARFADDLVVLINAYKRHDWLIGAVDKRLREEFAKLQVEINDKEPQSRPGTR